MPENRAIKIVADGQAKIVETEIPKLPNDKYILVKVTAVALNPTDWKHIDSASAIGCLNTQVGCDYAGIVEEVGSGVTKDFKKGDRITGPVNGSNPHRLTDGSFSNYIAVLGDIQIKTPELLTDEQAASLGIAITTVGQSLFQTLGLPLPGENSGKTGKILIYGGSSAMGCMGIQFAKAVGFEVITTCSPSNFNLVKSLGADHIFDYNDASSAASVRTLTGNKLMYAWDCISLPETGRFCANAVSTEGAKYSALLPHAGEAAKEINPKLETFMTLYYVAFNEPVKFYADIPASPESFEFARKFWDISAKLLAEGTIKTTPIAVNVGGSGLEGVLAGLEELKNGKVSGKKLVYVL
ncbi:hypothetical protein TD95_001996 [Thielaviopsis punctulata]|uniref:Enoyl reductase (ER) domain-containing protein n=1 Tax=Thielaviopsis punctulata TaxID=72032 RepID=A0A0F4ZHZ5_9PEZI|nr:hypothetical protein TD95_001996 [Thielaviopsis punctulata]